MTDELFIVSELAKGLLLKRLRV